MKILFLSQVLPYPLDAGPKVRSFYNISYLAQKHSIILLTFVRNFDSIESINYLKTICDQVETVRMPRSRMRDAVSAFKSLVNGEPFLITRDSILEMEEKLAELVKRENFDAIHADQLWMAPYAIKGLKAAAKIGQTPMIVLDQHNAVFMIPQRMADSTRNPLIKMWLLREAKFNVGI